MRKTAVFALLIAVCVFIGACSAAKSTDAFIEMQMIYEENPAFWSKDIKLVLGEKIYSEADWIIEDIEKGDEIGFADDEYGGWLLYELNGYDKDLFLLAQEKDNPDCTRIMTTYPTSRNIWRQYVLENAIDRERMERMLSVTLYKDGRANLATPPISSYTMVGNYYYSFENGELLIFQERENIIARFAAPKGGTLIFVSATIPLFANEGARYVQVTDKEAN